MAELTKERIAEIRRRVASEASWWYCDDVPDLLDALEEAQAEIERLRETLEKVEPHAMWSYGSGQDAAGKWHEVRFCVECGELFKRANGDVNFEGKHTGECAFARVRGGDTLDGPTRT